MKERRVRWLTWNGMCLLLVAAVACPSGGDRPSASAAAPESTRAHAAAGLDTSRPSADTTASRSFGGPDSWGLIARIAAMGDSLFIYDLYGPSSISVLDRRSGRIVGRFGRKGYGPGEYRTMTDVFPARVDGRFWVFDVGARRLSLYGPPASGSTTPRLVRTVPVQAPGRAEYVRFTHSGLLMVGEFDRYPVLFADSSGRRVDRGLGRFPVHAPGDSTHTRLNINRPMVAFDPGLGRVALAYRYQNVVQLYDLASERVRTITGPEPFTGPRDEDILDLNPSTVAYWQVQATKHFVYALFCGCFLSRRTLPQLKMRLHVFTWTGKLVTILPTNLNNASFAVSPDDRYLYSTTDEPYPHVRETLLPASLRGGGKTP